MFKLLVVILWFSDPDRITKKRKVEESQIFVKRAKYDGSDRKDTITIDDENIRIANDIKSENNEKGIKITDDVTRTNNDITGIEMETNHNKEMTSPMELDVLENSKKSVPALKATLHGTIFQVYLLGGKCFQGKNLKSLWDSFLIWQFWNQCYKTIYRGNLPPFYTNIVIPCYKNEFTLILRSKPSFQGKLLWNLGDLLYKLFSE